MAICAIAPAQTHAQTLRLATYNVELSRDGPGLLLRDIKMGNDAQIAAVSEVIARVAPDIVAVQGIDFDHALETLSAFNMQLDAPYDHIFALPSNRGLATGLDLNGNGRLGEAADAQGFGHFRGQGAMAILSRFPIIKSDVQDLTDLLWKDVPGALLPRNPDGTVFPDAHALTVQRLSSSGHWIVPVRISDARRLTLMTFHASPPVFDGPEDQNGRRNADEIGLWSAILDGLLGHPPNNPFVIAGSATLDPYDSDGRNASIRRLLDHVQLQDVEPSSTGGAMAGDQGHKGPNALDTVDWGAPGRLRADYVLPSTDLIIQGSGVFWPAPGVSGHDLALRASRHRLVWVDVALGD